MELIAKAIKFAKEKHNKQKDDEGHPYFYHVIKVGDTIKNFTNDEEVIASAYLHDTLEDTDTTYEELVKEFGERVASIVHEVTHEGNKSRGFYFPRLKSKEAIMIKLADRLHNISRMDCWDEDRQEYYLKRTRFWKSREGEKSW
jgi:(p)ppGpp synthase/HD superfamily hydrolase